jgi:hypothetical protein
MDGSSRILMPPVPSSASSRHSQAQSSGLQSPRAVKVANQLPRRHVRPAQPYEARPRALFLPIEFMDRVGPGLIDLEMLMQMRECHIR